jgi:hypothetical protein
VTSFSEAINCAPQHDNEGGQQRDCNPVVETRLLPPSGVLRVQTRAERKRQDSEGETQNAAIDAVAPSSDRTTKFSDRDRLRTKRATKCSMIPSVEISNAWDATYIQSQQ